MMYSNNANSNVTVCFFITYATGTWLLERFIILIGNKPLFDCKNYFIEYYVKQ